MNRRIFTWCGLLAGLLLFACSCKKDTPRLQLSSVELKQTVWNGTLEYKDASRLTYSVYLSFVSDSTVEVSTFATTDPTAAFDSKDLCSYTMDDRILTLRTRGALPLNVSIDRNSWYLIRKEPSLLVFQANAGNPAAEATMTLHKKL